ncbi:MAG: lytic transglycosylase domain-containing protein [Paracoccaceae bacterium]
MPNVAQGQGLTLSSKSRADLLRSQLSVLDNRASSQYSNSVKLQPPRAIIPGTPQALATYTATNSPYLAPAKTAAQTYDIPETLFLRLIQQESGWNPKALSPKGAFGLAQLMPATARYLRVNAQVPTENLNGGARYLRLMYDRFGSWRLALAAYNAGPEAVEKYKGIPPYTETQNYVQAILTER